MQQIQILGAQSFTFTFWSVLKHVYRYRQAKYTFTMNSKLVAACDWPYFCRFYCAHVTRYDRNPRRRKCVPLRCRCGGGAVIAPESRRSHYVVTVYPSGARKSRHDSLEYLSSVVHDPQHDATMLKNQKVKIKPPKNVQTNARVFFFTLFGGKWFNVKFVRQFIGGAESDEFRTNRSISTRCEEPEGILKGYISSLSKKLSRIFPPVFFACSYEPTTCKLFGYSLASFWVKVRYRRVARPAPPLSGRYRVCVYALCRHK